MKNLKNFGVQELEVKELIEIDGGLWLGGKLKALKKIVEWIGLADMAEDFVDGVSEGWSSRRQ